LGFPSFHNYLPYRKEPLVPYDFEQGYAVVIGVGADLPVTIQDATALADLLRDSTRCAYPRTQVKLLSGENARRQQVLDALDWLTVSSGPDATVMIYFSGHGIETPDYYLMPYGYSLSDLTNTAISGATFTKKLRAIQAQKLLVLLDCCHAGGQAEPKDAVKSPLPPDVLSELGQSSGRVIIASSRRDEKSWTGQPYSVFTAALLEGLAGYNAFEQDGFARVLDVALWVGRKVPERTGDKQHPIVKISNLADNFALAWYAGGAKSPQPLSWTVTPPASTPSATPAEIASWQRQLASYRENLLLIEERMSEYVEFSSAPLQLIRNKRLTDNKISQLEQKLGIR
jgi:hypothetical protein